MAIRNYWNATRGAVRRWGEQIGAVFAKRGTKAAALVVVLAASLAGGVWWLWLVHPEWVSITYWQQGAPTSRSEVFRNLGLFALAVIGLGFGIWRAWTAHRQVNVAEQGHITERFSQAAEHLGSEQLPVRLGGIYALWRLAQDSPARDMHAVIDILCAFVRNPPHEPTESAAAPSADPTHGAGTVGNTRPDVQAIMTMIGEKDAAYRRHLEPSYFLNLAAADLTAADLNGADLSGAKLSAAKLSGAKLMRADLSGGVLNDADLSGGYLLHADLSNAGLYHADLSGAYLNSANLSGADFWSANLSGAFLSGANLLNADLVGTDLSGANLQGAKNLTQDQLESALAAPPPKSLPDGLTWPFVKKGGTWMRKE